MTSYLLRRLLAALPVLIAVSFGTFALLFVIPGDPAVTLAGDAATPETIAAIRIQLGLDQPVLTQYVDWVTQVIRGDLGASLYSGRSVAEAIGGRLPPTLSLTGLALLFTAAVSIPLGVVTAIRQNRPIDHVGTTFSTLGVAIPNFWLGIILVTVVSHRLGLLPPVGYRPISDGWWDWLRHLTLPAVTLGMGGAAEATRQLRGSMVATLGSEFVTAARARGLSESAVVGKHALRNAAGPLTTVLGLQLAFLLGGSVVVEQVFGIRGLGSLAVTAVFERDIPMIQGVVLISGLFVIVVNILIDLAYAVINPRLRRR